MDEKTMLRWVFLFEKMGWQPACDEMGWYQDLAGTRIYPKAMCYEHGPVFFNTKCHCYYSKRPGFANLTPAKESDNAGL